MTEFFEHLWVVLEKSILLDRLEPELEAELLHKSLEDSAPAAKSDDVPDLSHILADMPSEVDLTDSSDSSGDARAGRRIRGLLSYDTYGLNLSSATSAKKRKKRDKATDQYPIGVIEEMQPLGDDLRALYDTHFITCAAFDVSVKGENQEKRRLGRKLPKIRAPDRPPPWRFGC